METQAFSSFLEERKWPSSDIFDELITSRRYKQVRSMCAKICVTVCEVTVV